MTGNERREESRDQYRPIFIEDPREAREEILALWEDRIGPDCRRLVDEAMADVELLFAGGVPGYRESNTPYHTLGHTVMVFIAMGRILNGAVHDGIDLSSEEVTAGLLAALYHDTGYVQDASDSEGTGAKHTVGHEHRSGDQLRRFLADREDLSVIGQIAIAAISHTDVRGSSGNEDSAPPSAESEHGPGKARLGVYLMYADLFAQMADRAYLEKLPLLYEEFREAGFTQYRSPWDVLAGTSEFAAMTLDNKRSQAAEISRLLAIHFQHRNLRNSDLYITYIRKNLKYLNALLKERPSQGLQRLRRIRPVADVSDVT